MVGREIEATDLSQPAQPGEVVLEVEICRSPGPAMPGGGG